jgi:RNA polymerase sigma-70 factor, ECF subfamily
MKPQDTLNWTKLTADLKRFVYRRTKDKALTEDIVHDIFLKIQNKAAQLREREKVYGWIYQIARHAIIDHYRRQLRGIEAKDIDWDATPPNFNDCVSNTIEQLIPSLPDKYRVPFEMATLHSLSQLEVADQLSLNYATAKARVQRARKLLRKKMEAILIVKTDGYGNVIVCQNRRRCE